MARTNPDTPLPAEACATCDTRRGWRSWTSWARVLVPLLFGVLMTLGGAYLALRGTAEANAAEVRHLREGRTEDREELRRVAGSLVDAQRQAAADRQASEERFTEIRAALARIEGRLETDRTRRIR